MGRKTMEDLAQRFLAEDGGTLSASETALSAAAAACVSAAEASPCGHCGNLFAEQWDNAPWHCFACKKAIDA